MTSLTEPKPDLKGVIQVKDGPGWKPKLDPKIVFQPIMDAINAIRKVDPNIYIGLSYGANSEHDTPQSKNMFNMYGFTDLKPPKDGSSFIDTTAIDKVDITEMLDIMKGGSGQATVLYSREVKDMLKDVKKFIIIPFDTMNSKAGVTTDDPKAYGHKDDCLAFAQKFLDLDKSKGGSIIIGWQPNTSNLDLINTTTARKQATGVKKGQYEKLHFALGAGAADVDATVVEYINFLIDNWNKESQEFIDSKIASGKKNPHDDVDEKLGDDGKKPDDVEKLHDDATEKKPTGVTAEQIKELRDKLEGVKLSDGEKKTAYGIAQEIFNVFFGGGDDKSKQTKPFLTEKVAALAKMAIFGKEPTKGNLDEITKKLENPSTAKKIEAKEDTKEKEVKDEEAEKAAAEEKRKEEDVEKKRKEEEDAAAKKKGSMGKQLSVMTFNTWYHTFNATTKNAAFCNEEGDNECLKNNRNAVLAQMAKTGPVVILLQEFTYGFEEFIGPGVTIGPNKIESTNNVVSGSGTKSIIKAFRHFEITYNTRKFYVYIGQIGQSVMATIYSSDLVDDSATEFFMGNLASGMHEGGDTNTHLIVPTFSGDKNSAKLKIDDIKQAGNPYSFRGGSRPFTILRFDTADLKLILLNIHSPHPYVFGDLHDGNSPNPDPGAPKAPITVAEFAFNALGPFFTKHVFTSDIDKKDYTFVAGGDFNTDAATAVSRLNSIFNDTNPKIDRTTNKTCCVDAPGKKFDSTVDHIFSTSVISDYTVHDIKTLIKSKAGNMNYFSDHLPVYATVTLPTAPAKAPAGSGAPAPSESESGSNETQRSNESVPIEQQNAEAETSSSGASSASSATSATSATSEARLKVSGESSEAQVQNDGPSSSATLDPSEVASQVQLQQVSQPNEQVQNEDPPSSASGASSATSAVPSAVPAPVSTTSGASSAILEPTPVPVPAPAPVTTSAPSGPITSITIMPPSENKKI